MGFVHRKESRFRKYQQDSSMQKLVKQFVTTLKTAFLILIVILLPVLIAYALPDLKFFFLEVAPRLWKLCYKLLTPPYLFVLMNFIIVTIVVTTHLHKKAPSAGRVAYKDGDAKLESVRERLDPVVEKVLEDVPLNTAAVDSLENKVSWTHSAGETALHLESESHETPVLALHRKDPAETKGFIEGELGMPNSTTAAREIALGSASQKEPKTDANSKSRRSSKGQTPSVPASLNDEAPDVPTLSEERPLPSVRFTHRKAVKGNSESKTLGISRPVKKGDTIDATWKAITEGKHHPPLNRHHRKFDTWDLSASPRSQSPSASLRKAETFDTIAPPASSTSDETASVDWKAHHPRIRRREPSISQEELNKKVESFIDKFNEQIRLQRQESLLRYMQMVERGAH